MCVCLLIFMKQKIKFISFKRKMYCYNSLMLAKKWIVYIFAVRPFLIQCCQIPNIQKSKKKIWILNDMKVFMNNFYDLYDRSQLLHICTFIFVHISSHTRMRKYLYKHIRKHTCYILRFIMEMVQYLHWLRKSCN